MGLLSAFFHFEDRFLPFCSDEKTFWITTGLYPQEFVLCFSSRITISKIQTITTNGLLRKSLRLLSPLLQYVAFVLKDPRVQMV